MSTDIITPDRVCYVHCDLCNTILAVSVPCSSSNGTTTSINIVTVRCGHCANLLSVNISSLLETLPLPANQEKPKNPSYVDANVRVDGTGSSSKDHKFNAFKSVDHEGPRLSVIRPPQKRQRVPSAYNRFIKEEIQRIKAGNPEISHREAFSTAAKNWAHFPHIHFGLKLDGTSM